MDTLYSRNFFNKRFTRLFFDRAWLDSIFYVGVALFVYVYIYKTCSRRGGDRECIVYIQEYQEGNDITDREGRRNGESRGVDGKGKRISVWDSGRKSFIESAGMGMYPCALICKICSFEKLTRNCVAASKLQNPMRLSARVATPSYEHSRI